MGWSGKGTGKRMRSSKRLNGDQALADYAEPIVMEEVSHLDTVPMNGEGLNRDNNMEEVLVHETTSNVTGSFDADKSTQSLKTNEYIVFALFGVLISSIEDLDVLTRKIEAGDYGTGPKEDTPIVKSVSFTKPVSYVEAAGASSSKPSTGKANFHHLVFDNVFDGVQLSILMNVVHTFDSIKGLEDVLESGTWMIRNSPIILKKWTMNTRSCKEELTLIQVWVKIHDVSIQVFLEDGISLIASQIGKPIMLHSFTSSMCIVLWGRSSFARCLIEIKVDEALKDSITMGIPLPEGEGFTKEMEKPSKAANLPSSSFSHGSAKNGVLQYHSSASNIHTSNPYNALDDMESDEEVEVVYDETTNLFGNNIMRAT
ncbi:zinc knuckle CX2CX4HX4C containing protein [Tanacetum coccineum]